MKAISIRQPFAEHILAGTRTREHRPRPCEVRGRVAIHASRSVDAGHLGEVAEAGLPLGRLVGTVEVVGCEELPEGGYAWLLADPVRFRAVLPYPGRAGWFDVPDELVADAHLHFVFRRKTLSAEMAKRFRLLFEGGELSAP